MIKIFTQKDYVVGDSVNSWLNENENKIEVQNINQSSCYRPSDGIYITVMIEYIELEFNYPSLDDSDLFS
jgi:hypothetical protein